MSRDSEDGGIRVVVVEDDPASADLLRRRLEANGMRVSVGTNGEEGLALVRQLHPQLVLLDVMLPDMNGYDVCLQIKSDHATEDIPVIFLSARGDVYDKVRGLSSGAVDYVTKPVHPAELIARVDAVLRRVEARAPRLPAPDAAAKSAQPIALVLVADPARRQRLAAALSPRFQIAGADATVVDLVVVEEGQPSPAIADGATLLRLAAGMDEVARFDAELLRRAELGARQRALRADVEAATEALVTLAAALEAHDRSFPAHGAETARRSVSIAAALGLDEQTQRTVRLGALLRDVGYAKLPAEIVAHPGQLSDEERSVMERHSALGEELLRGFTPLAHILPVVRLHHEQLDGSGYPDKLRGEQIPLEVRIVTVADRFEALLVDRPDRAALRPSDALRVLQEQVVRGQLDAAVVAALASLMRKEGEGGR